MQSKNYYRISRILFYVSVSFICASLLSFFWTLITSSRIYFDPSSTGLKEFISYYQPQIAIAGVGIVLFALWITSERMKQTKDQIDVMADNNKFNNFFKHREKFIGETKVKRLIKMFSRITSTDSELLAGFLYQDYYYASHNQFVPRLNETALDRLDKIEKIFDSNHMKKDKIVSFFSQAAIEEFKKIMIGQAIYTTIFTVVKSIVASIKEMDFENHEEDTPIIEAYFGLRTVGIIRAYESLSTGNTNLVLTEICTYLASKGIIQDEQCYFGD